MCYVCIMPLVMVTFKLPGLCSPGTLTESTDLEVPVRWNSQRVRIIAVKHNKLFYYVVWF
jgi:hypothetical protein